MGLVRRGTAPLRLPLAVPIPTNRAVVTAQRALCDVCDTIIAHRRSEAGGQPDLLGLLVDARDDGGAADRTQVRDHVLVFLLAGHETTPSLRPLRCFCSGPTRRPSAGPGRRSTT
jgi:cytochrome P450